jgi:ribonuclease E
VADFDGNPAQPSQPVMQPESFAPAHERPSVDHGQPEPARTTMATEAELAQEAEHAAARRRSTVREKVSFLADAPPASPSPASQSPDEPAPAPDPAPSQAGPAAETTTDAQPRRAGWWSRRFGNGE